jgi:hypothetical protein
LSAKEGVIQISPDKALSVSDGDYRILRPLINKYRELFER